MDNREKKILYHINVTFGRDRDYEFRLHESDTAGVERDEAQRWFDEQYVSLGCEPINPMGKVLLSDKLLSVARAVGAEAFSKDTDWFRSFARYAAVLVGKPNVTINVQDNSVGF